MLLIAHLEQLLEPNVKASQRNFCCLHGVHALIFLEARWLACRFSTGLLVEGDRISMLQVIAYRLNS